VFDDGVDDEVVTRVPALLLVASLRDGVDVVAERWLLDVVAERWLLDVVAERV